MSSDQDETMEDFPPNDDTSQDPMDEDVEKSAVLDEVNSSSGDEELEQENTEPTTKRSEGNLQEDQGSGETGDPGDTYDPTEANDSNEPDTEMVSEDELPSDGAPKLDTEAVSDEELQEMPGNDLDTEAVSDDELPPVKKKRKHRRHSASDDENSSGEKEKDKDKKKKRRRHDSEEKKTSRSRSRGKDRKQEKSKRSSSKSRSSRSRESSPRRKTSKSSSKSTNHSKSKVLPELEKYWKAVRDDPSDFTGWTYLLQYVDQENDVDAAREAYDSFLRIYPYCYGYWRKYADYEKHKGDKSRCEEVFSRGLKAIPLSVDLWLHYLNFCKTTMKDDESQLREQFKRAIDTCGLEFRSDRLWDFYIKWESDLKNYQNVFAIYDELLKTPVLGYKTHFDNFEDFVRSYQPNRILSVDEFLELRAEVVQKIKEKGVTADPSAALPPGDDPTEEEPSAARADEETTLMREKIVSIRKKVFKNTGNEVSKRWKFEEGIKRPYFHVKPLETAQVNTWRDYLDFEMSGGDMHRTVILFERCLIACALYEEFWLKYIRYLESVSDNDELVRNVYQRACLIHHSKKPYLALDWASFEESRGNIEGARKVLNHIEKQVPNMLLIFIRRINLERRVKNLEGAAKLYDYYLKNNYRNKNLYVPLAAKYARFCQLVLNDTNKGVEIIKKAIEKFPDELRLYIPLLDLYMAKPNTTEECLNVFNKILSRDSIEPETKIIFAQRKIEFLEDFGADINRINSAHVEYSLYMKQMENNKNHPNREDKSEDSRSKSKSEGSHSGTGGHTNSNSSGYAGSGYNNYQGGQNYSGGQYGSGQAYNAQASNQYPADQNSSSYGNWNYSQANYTNANQSWGGYNYYS